MADGIYSAFKGLNDQAMEV